MFAERSKSTREKVGDDNQVVRSSCWTLLEGMNGKMTLGLKNLEVTWLSCSW